MGKTDEARAILDQLTALTKKSYVSPVDFALVHTGLGEVDEAIEWLEKAQEQRVVWMVWAQTDPRWDPLRSEPRFQELIRRMNFPE
jgi:hypothetical protein